MPSNAEPLDLRHPFPPEEYAARRARVYDRLGAGAKALLQGAGPVRGFQAFRQSNDFHYLCGVELPQCCLLLDADSRAATLYLPPRDPHASSEGDVLGAEDAAALVAETGLDAVYDSSALADRLRKAVRLYTPFAPAEGSQGSRDVLLHADKKVAADPWDGRPSREEWLRGLLAQRLPGLEMADLSSILDELRSVKSPREVALCRRAGELSAQAVQESMRATRPGLREYHLGAIADFVFAAGGARGQGYRPIIPSGANIWYSHYFRNDAELREGDLILMDCAPDLCNYTSDIGRMWPVSDSYSPQQRELYGFMVRYHQTLLRLLRPGVLPEQVLEEAAQEMRPVVESTQWSKPIYRAAAERTLTFKGHLSHPVGMAVHDVGTYFGKPMVPGLVFSVDPQMWVPEEKLYVRVEDTGVMGEVAFEPFTSAAPLALDDVEALMKQTSALKFLVGS